MRSVIFFLILLFPIQIFAQKYPKSEQLNSVNYWLDYYFESNYANLELDPYSHKISLTTTMNGYKQHIDKVYLDITDNGSSWKGAINMRKAVWKCYEDYKNENYSMTFNTAGYMTEYINYGYGGRATAYKYHGNTYSDKQTVVTNSSLFEGNTTLEKPYYYISQVRHDDVNKTHFIDYNYEDNTYRIGDEEGNIIATLDLIDREPNGDFDYTLFGIREVGTYKKGYLNGKYAKYNAEGITMEEGIMRDGYRVGTWTEFTDDFELYDLVDDLCMDHDLDFLDTLDEEKHFNQFTINKDQDISGVVKMTYKTGETLGYYSYNEDDDNIYGTFELFYKNGTVFTKGKYSRNGDLKNVSLFKESGAEITINTSQYIDD